jgi:copper(I)-binding protein
MANSKSSRVTILIACMALMLSGPLHAASLPIVVSPITAIPDKSNGRNNLDLFGALTNTSGVPDAITGVSTPGLHKVELLRWVRGLQEPQKLPLVLPPNAMTKLDPNGVFIRLPGLRPHVDEDQTFPVTLHFLHAPDAVIKVKLSK